jgi:hypothetical protein
MSPLIKRVSCASWGALHLTWKTWPLEVRLSPLSRTIQLLDIAAS